MKLRNKPLEELIENLEEVEEDLVLLLKHRSKHDPVVKRTINLQRKIQEELNRRSSKADKGVGEDDFMAYLRGERK